MHLGAAGGHHHPVEVVLGDGILDDLLARLRACILLKIGVDYIGQAGRIPGHLLAVHGAGDVQSALANEDADTDLFGGTLLWHDIAPVQFFPLFGEDRDSATTVAKSLISISSDPPRC